MISPRSFPWCLKKRNFSPFKKRQPSRMAVFFAVVDGGVQRFVDLLTPLPSKGGINR